MDFVYKEDYFSVAVNNLLYNTLETFLKLSLILCSCYKSTKVKRIDLPALEVFRYIAINYLLCDSF